MENTINERYVKLSSQLPFPRDIQLGEDIVITIGGQNYIGNCVKTEDRDNQDGSINKIFTLKYLGE